MDQRRVTRVGSEVSSEFDSHHPHHLESRSMLRAVVIILALLMCMGSVHADSVRVSAKRDSKTKLTTITVNLTPQETYRHLNVQAVSENVYKSSYRQLEGYQSHAQYRFEFSLPNDGAYTIASSIGDSLGHTIATDDPILFTMPPNEEQ